MKENIYIYIYSIDLKNGTGSKVCNTDVLKIIRIWCGEGGEHHKQQYCDELHHFTLQNIYKKKKEQLNIDDELEWSDGGIWYL